MLRSLFAACLIAGLAAAMPLRADAKAAELCRAAANRAAAAYDVPAEMLAAITLVETRRTVGGRTGPWPWTMNIAGTGRWFDSRSAALAHAKRVLAGGETSFDVGCFQLNYRWHGDQFTSLSQMFDPEVGAQYAAHFLRTLYEETGDWLVAAGYFHSRTPEHFERYTGLISAALGGDPGTPVIARAPPVWPLAPGQLNQSPPPGATSGAVALAVFGARRALLPMN